MRVDEVAGVILTRNPLNQDQAERFQQIVTETARGTLRADIPLAPSADSLLIPLTRKGKAMTENILAEVKEEVIEAAEAKKDSLFKVAGRSKRSTVLLIGGAVLVTAGGVTFGIASQKLKKVRDEKFQAALKNEIEKSYVSLDDLAKQTIEFQKLLTARQEKITQNEAQIEDLKRVVQELRSLAVAENAKPVPGPRPATSAQRH